MFELSTITGFFHLFLLMAHSSREDIGGGPLQLGKILMVAQSLQSHIFNTITTLV